MKKVLRILFPCIWLSTIGWTFNHFPVRFEVLESANQIVTYAISIESNKEFTENIQLDLQMWDVSSQNQITFLPYKGEWLHLVTRSVDLIPNSTMSIPFVLHVPLIQGEVFAQIILASQVPGTGFMISKGVPVFLAVLGTEQPTLSLKAFDIVMTNNEWQVEVDLENKGRIHLRPRIEMRVITDERLPTFNWKRVMDDVPVYAKRNRVFKKIFKEYQLTGNIVVELKVEYYNTRNQIISERYRIRKRL